MNKYTRNLNRKISAILILALLLSITSCGKAASNDISEYGGENVDISSIPEPDNSSLSEDLEIADELSNESTDESSDTSNLSGKKLTWNEVYDTGDAIINIDSFVEVPDLNSLNVYTVESTSYTDDQEATLVSNLFDSDVEKIEKLAYTNETDYIMQLYKLDFLMAIYSRGEHEIQDFVLIDKDYDKTYTWVDNESYSIHMYKGKFQGIDYALILSFDYICEEQYIYFMPVNINDYYPEHRFKTLLAKREIDVLGNSTGVSENKCAISEDEIKDKASEFLQYRLGLNENDCKVGYHHQEYLTYLADMNLGFAMEYTDEESITSITFSEEDYLTTFATVANEQIIRNNILLAEQEDVAKEYMDDSHDETNNRISASMNAAVNMRSENRELDPDLYYEDGYAVYLEDIFNIYESDSPTIETTNGSSWGFSSEIGNKGCVYITENGIFGADLLLVFRTIDEVEDVELLKFDNIKQSVKNVLKNEVNYDEMGKGNLTLPGMNLCYSLETDEKTGQMSLVPTWKFLVFSDTGTAFIKINAITGELQNCTSWKNQ
ncbi:MAG: hypothetical protein J5517_10540 [Eubacterium sp.]|nr:hypothetical protein [Eubacterium sp.]